MIDITANNQVLIESIKHTVNYGTPQHSKILHESLCWNGYDDLRFFHTIRFEYGDYLLRSWSFFHTIRFEYPLRSWFVSYSMFQVSSCKLAIQHCVSKRSGGLESDDIGGQFTEYERSEISLQ